MPEKRPYVETKSGVKVPVYTTPRKWPRCLSCGKLLPREIRQTGLHHPTCPWNYYIECPHCGYQNNVSKLLGFWAGCSAQCVRAHQRGEEP